MTAVVDFFFPLTRAMMTSVTYDKASVIYTGHILVISYNLFSKPHIKAMLTSS